MKPDVKKIIADIKATKGNRKFCNGLAGTLQDDNYASSICKYVKTVTPERIDLLIEYAEKLEAEVTDMAVQLANAESKCRELAAENSAIKVMNDCLSEELRGYESDGAFEGPKMHLLWWKTETPVTEAFLAEVRASGVEMAMEHMQSSGSLTFGDCYISLNEFAAQLRQGGAV
ncbi:hypothetical protein HVX13_10490 [Citrobacter freundii]|nr:hypothetical protein [Citrobacter freundii]MBA8333688.1 hypothetical protein [Citrobacter freundii]QLM86264.1 hypothetical protein HVX13_10490 [Citrobacter freundii]QMM22219.1 hypothetical protein HVX18_10485 [Citrobacter freundii]